jgi:hypothetical protein
MTTKGLLVRLEAKPGKDDVEKFLRSAEPLRCRTTALASRISSGAFRGSSAKHGLSLLGGLPDMDLNRVLAAKLPSAAVVSGAR